MWDIAFILLLLLLIVLLFTPMMPWFLLPCLGYTMGREGVRGNMGLLKVAILFPPPNSASLLADNQIPLKWKAGSVQGFRLLKGDFSPCHCHLRACSRWEQLAS